MGDGTASHAKACRGFSAIVARGEGRWTEPSPCPGWDAGDIVEHVIGFHDVLLLRPLQLKPTRPKDDPAARWEMTVDAIGKATVLASAPPPDDPDGESGINLARLLPALTTDVLVHTWDLAKTIGVDPCLDPTLCEAARRSAVANAEGLRASGMFGPAVPVPEKADAATRLIALLGRDPDWAP